MLIYTVRNWLKRFSQTCARSKPRTQSARRRGGATRLLSTEQLEYRITPTITYTWNGSENTLWSDANNWTNNGGPNAPGAPTGSPTSLDNLVFPSTGTKRNTNNDLPIVDGNGNPVTLAFNSITFGGTGYSLGGNPITLGSTSVANSGNVIANAGASGESISLNIQMGAAAGSRQLFTINSSADLTISGQLSGTTGADLTKQGTGILYLTNDNSAFTGPIELANNGGVIQITNVNALGDTSGATTVGTNAQLQLNIGNNTLQEALILNGTGPISDGALQSVAGNPILMGTIELDSNAAIGVKAGTLTDFAQITDLGSGHSLTKVGAGTLTLDPLNSDGSPGYNTYRGTTSVNNGVLQIETGSQVVNGVTYSGLGTADGTTATGTFVNYNPATQDAGTLQIKDPLGLGITILNELLEINGPGSGNVGALDGIDGNNVWTGTVNLGSIAPIGSDSNIGVSEGNSLLISGVVQDPNGSHGFTKIGLGKLILTNSNTYRGGGIVGTTIAAGVVNIRDSNALGGAGDLGVWVQNGAALELQVDNIPDSVTHNTNSLIFSTPIVLPTPPGFTGLTGTGPSGQGALVSISGVNTITSTIQLYGGDAAIGVLPDPNPTNNPNYSSTDYSLTLAGNLIVGLGFPTFEKLGGGQLILPYANASFEDPVHIEQGWVTIQDNHSLGGTIAAVDQNEQPTTTIDSGAALHLDPQSGSTLDIGENFVIAGKGITHTFGLINQEGAIENLVGSNTIHGNIVLQQAAGIGVENVFGASQLTLTGAITDRPPVFNVAGNPGLGTTAENDNVFDTGSLTGGTISINANVYSIPDDIQVYLGDYQNNPASAILVYDSTTNGNPSNPTNTNAATITINYTSTAATATANFGSTGWNLGPQKTGYTALPSSKITIVVNQGGSSDPTGVTLWSYDATIIPSSNLGGGITKLGSQLLIIQSPGSYTGNNSVNEGVLRAESNTALGTGTSGTSTNGIETYFPSTTTVAPGDGDLQTLTVTGLPGTFTLTFNGQTTSALSTNSLAAQVQAALTALTSIGGVGGTVSVTRSANVFAVTFGGSFIGSNQPPLVATATPGAVVTVATLRDGDGTALELEGPPAIFNGGISAGLNIWNDHLVLDSGGNAAFGDAPLTILANDNLWQGPVTLQTGSTIQVRPGARVTLGGSIDDASNPSFSGSDLTLSGGGELNLAGSNTYVGTTFVNQGVMELSNSQALGGSGIAEIQTVTLSGATTGTFTLTFNGQTTAPLHAGSATLAADMQTALNALTSIGGTTNSVSVSQSGPIYTITFQGNFFGFNQAQMTATDFGGTVAIVGTLQDGAGGTVVANGASIQLEGNLTIAGEPLIIQGAGNTTTTNVPLGWFNIGPAPINGGQTAGSEAVTGRITAIAVDPGDTNVIYIGTAGGGAWKTRDGGHTWLPLFDTQVGISEVQAVTVTGTSGTFTLTYNGQTTTALPFNATPLQVESALNTLSTIGGANGSVSVAANSGPGYTVTFNGAIAGISQLLVAAGAGSSVTEITPGVPSIDPIFVGAITLDPNNPNIIYVGTGETNNSVDSYYGTGIYKSTDSGETWSIVAGTNVQTIGIIDTTGGTGMFTLGLGGSTSAPLPGNASAAQVQAALNGLASIGGAGASVSVTKTQQNEVQLINANAAAATSGGFFTLTFNGQTTAQLPVTYFMAMGTPPVTPPPQLPSAATVQAALNALTSIGGVGGSVTVTLNNITTGTYTVTFGGTMANNPQPFIVITGTNVAPDSVTEMTKGGTFYTVTFGGSLATANITPIQAISQSKGITLSVTQTEIANPFYGKGISQIIVDDTGGGIFVADGDGGSGANEEQTLSPRIPNGSTFTMTFTGPDPTGALVTDTTVAVTYQSNNTAQTAADMQAALEALSNIGAGNVLVTVVKGRGGRGGGGPGGFLITFQNALGLTSEQLITTNYPTVGPGNFISISETVRGGPRTVVNGTTGNPGIWRYASVGGVTGWFNLTSYVSLNRSTVVSPNSNDTIYGPTSRGGNGPASFPNTPGPDDNYEVSFPQTNATWTSIALVYNPITAQPTLLAALGTAAGNADKSGIYTDNGVFWTYGDAYSNTPIWYAGDPGTSLPLTPDAQATGMFPFSTIAANTNGNIKIGAVGGGTISAQPVPFSFNPGDVTIYAVVSHPGSGLTAIYVSNTDGLSWAAVANQPPNFLSNQGAYDSAIDVVSTTNVYVGGSVSSSTTNQGQIYETTDGGNSWTDISVDVNGNGPHTSQHAIVLDSAGLLVGNDGGIWERSNAGLWIDLNGDLAISQINSVATASASSNTVYAATQTNGTEVSTSTQAWTMLDDSGALGSMGGDQVYVDQNNPNNIYEVQVPLTSTAVVRRSTDGGAHWTTIQSSITSRVMPLVVDNINPDRLLVGDVFNGIENVEQSLDQGNSWTNLDAPIAPVAIAIPEYQGAFVADPGFPDSVDLGSNVYDPNTIYITDGKSVDVTKDQGQSWVDRTTDLAGLGSIVDLVVDPTNRDTVYAVRDSFGSQVFVSTDAGQSWTDISGNLPATPAWTLVVDPRTGNLYVGTDIGVYELPAASSTWQTIGTGMPNTQVRDLILNLATNTLTAGTHGRGVYQLYLDDETTNGGALRADSGSSVWTGPILLLGDPTNNSVAIGANGQQNLASGISAAQLNIVGKISDFTPGSAPTLIKLGGGNVVLSGVNVYGGITRVEQGILVVNNPQALGATGSNQGTYVDSVTFPNTALELDSNLLNEPLFIDGTGVPFNGHNTGVVYNVNSNNIYTGTMTLLGNATIGVSSGTFLTIGSAPGLSGTGTITDNSKSYSLTKDLTGTLILNSVNTYTGGTNVDQGVLNIQNNLALGSGGAPATVTTVIDGAQLQLQGGITVSSVPLRITGSGINSTGAVENVSGVNTWAGSVTLAQDAGFAPVTTPASNATINVLLTNPTDQLDITGAIGQTAGGLGLTKIGLGRLILDNNTSNYSGQTVVSQGEIRIRQNKALGTGANNPAAGTVVQTGATLEVDGNPNNNNSSLTITGEDALLNGTGTPEIQTLTVVGTTGGLFNLSFNGNTTGTPLAYNASASVIQAALSKLLPLGGTLTVTPFGTNSFLIVFGGTLVGSDQPQITASTTTPALVTTLTTATVQDGGRGALLNLTGNNTWAGPVTLQSASAVNVSPGTTLTVSGVVGDNSSVPSPSLTKIGTGTMFFTRANTYTGATNVNAGVLNISNAAALGSTASSIQTATLSGPQTGFFNLTFNGQTTNPNLPGNVTAAQVQSELEQLSTIGSGNVTVTQSGSTYTITFVNALAGAHQQQITAKGGNGISVVMTTQQDGSYGTFVASGATLQVQGGINVIGEPLQLAGTGFNNAGALENVSGSNTWTANTTLASNIPLVVLAANTTIGVDQAADTFKVNGVIDDGGNAFGLTKIGPGTLDLAGTTSNTYTGATSVNTGTLLLDKSGGAAALAGSTLNVGDGIGAAGSAIARWISSNEAPTTATATVLSDGKLDLNNNAQTISTLNITDGTATTGTGAAGALTLTNLNMTGGSLTTGTNGSQVIVSGSSSLTATSDKSGSATISGLGILQLGNAARTLNVTAGSQATDLLVSSVIGGSMSAGSTALTKSGTGTAVFTAANTYTGTTSVTGDTLLVNGTIGPVSVNTNGTLGGSGTVGTITTAGGTVAPGSALGAAGTLTSGATTLDSNATFFIDINSASSYDVLHVNGAIDLANAKLVGDSTTNYVPPLTTQFTILTATGGLLNNDQFAQGSSVFINGRKFTITYNANSVVLTRVLANSNTTLTSSTTGNTSVYGQAVTFTATVASEAGSGTAPSGNVTFKVDAGTGNEVDVTKTLVNGVATLTFADLPGGVLSVASHTVSVSYPTGTDFNGSGASLTQTVNKANSSWTVNPPATTPVYGQVATYTVQLSAVPPGSGTPSGAASTAVTLYIDGTSVGTSAVTNGQATFAPTGLTAGQHLFNVAYVGDGNFNGFTNSTYGNFAYTINQDPTTTDNVTATTNPITFGQTATFSTTVHTTAPGGGLFANTDMVDFLDNGVKIGSGTVNPSTGKASFTTLAGALQGGSHTITARFNTGDPNFTGSSSTAPLAFSVTPSPTITTVTGSPAPSVYTQTVTLSAHVVAQGPGAGLATLSGNVIFYFDGTQVGNPIAIDGSGNAQTSVITPNPGTHPIAAVYQGNTDFATSPGTGSQIVTPPNIAQAVSASPSPALFGQSLTFSTVLTHTLAPTSVPSGTVIFSVTDGSGNSVKDASGNTVNPVSGNLAPISGSFNSSTSVPFTQLLNPGTYTITAAYSGDSNFYLNSTSITETVKAAPSVATLVSVTPSSATYGASVTLKAKIGPASNAPPAAGAPAAGETVTFQVDGTALTNGTTTIDSSGNATLVTTAIPAGQHTITVQYNGDTHFATSTSAGSPVNIAKGSVSLSAITSSFSSSVTYGNKVDFSVTVTPTNSPTQNPTGTVTFKDAISGAVLGSAQVNATTGKATLTTGTASSPLLNVGSYNIIATYNGDTNFNTSSPSTAYSLTITQGSTTVVLGPSASNTAVYGQGSAIIATVLPISPAAAAPAGTVTFMVGSTLIGPVTLVPQFDINGNPVDSMASLPATALSVGSYPTINATYNVPTSGAINFSGSSSTSSVSLTVTQAPSQATVVADSEPSVAGNNVTYTATVTSVSPNSGTPTGTVVFGINGVASNRITLSANGTATLVQSAPATAGIYTITVFYFGDGNFLTSNNTASPLQHSVVNPPPPPPPPPAPPAPTPLSQNGQFVTEAYLLLLNRGTDPGGLAYWTGQLDAGVPRYTLLVQIESSHEFHQDEVQTAFQTYLRRTADPGTLNGFANLLDAGQTMTQIRADLIGSDEYFARFGGGTNAGFLNALYSDVLHRPVDAFGTSFFLPLLQQFTPRTAVAQSLLSTSEATSDLVQALYATYLHRGADPGGLAFWTSYLLQANREEWAIAGFLESSEFFNNL